MSALIQAKVKFPSRVVNTRYGARKNVVFILNNGEETTIWSNPEDKELSSLKKNQKVTLIKDNDNKYSVLYQDSLEPDDSKLLPEGSQELESGWSNELKRTLCNEAIQLINFYKYCSEEVRQRIEDFPSEESMRTITTSIFIQAVRKGGY